MISQLFKEAAPWSWMIGAFALAAIIASIAAAVMRPNPTGSLFERFAISLGFMLALMLTCAYAVGLGRDAMLSVFTITNSGDKAVRLADGVSLQINALALGGSAMGWALLAFVICFVCAQQRRQAHRWFELVPAFALALPAGFAVTGVLSYVLGLIHDFSAIAAADPSSKALLLQKGMEELFTALTGLRHVFIGASVAGMIVGLIAAARDTRAYSVVTTAAAAGVFLLGSVAFVLTRGQAHDGAHPLTAIAGRDLPLDDLTMLPQSADSARERACFSAWGPMLTIRRGGAHLNGLAIENAQQLADDLTTLRNNYQLLHDDDTPLSPLLLAERELSSKELAPWLAALAKHGETKLNVVVVKKQSTETRTLGVLDRSQGCTLPLELDPSGVPLAQFADWGHAVAARKGEPWKLAP